MQIFVKSQSRGKAVDPSQQRIRLTQQFYTIKVLKQEENDEEWIQIDPLHDLRLHFGGNGLW